MSASPIHRLPSADVTAGARFEFLARQLSAQAHDESQPVTARLAFLREASRFEDLAALADADAILAAHAHEVA